MNNEKTFNFLMITAALLVLGIPVGIANIYLGYYVGESPCTVCWFQRIGMMITGCLGLCMVRYGPKIKYIATVLLFAGNGLYMAGRHVASMWTFDIGMGQADKLFGAHTYTWSFVVYWVIVVFTGAMLLFITAKSELMKEMASPETKVKPFSTYGKVVVILSFLVVCSNAFQAFFMNGIPPYAGKHAPNRFSLNLPLMAKTWTAENWSRLTKGSFTGRGIQTMPYIVGVLEPEEVTLNKSFTDGAIDSSGTLTVASETALVLHEITDRTKYPIAGVAQNEKTGELAFSTQEMGIFYTDPDAKQVTDYVVFDKPNGLDMKYIIGNTFVDQKAVIAAFNKIVTGVQKGIAMDPVSEWEYFRETTGDIGAIFSRDRVPLTAHRARWEFVDAIANDGKYVYMISLANGGNKNVILIKYDAADWQLSSETIIKAAPDLKIKDGRSVNEYYTTGLTCYDGKILALSPRYSTLLVIDPQTALVEKAYELQGLINPRSIFVRDGKLNVLDYKDGMNTLVQLNMPQLSAPVAVAAPEAAAPEAAAEEAPAEEAAAPEETKPES